MRREQGLVLDDRDEETAKLLQAVGIPVGVARALVFLTHVAEATSPEIEQAAGLRQPEVSVAMQFLRDRDWVKKRDLKREGKGRPIHAYALTVTMAEVADALELEKREEAARNIESLGRLRKLLP